MKHLYMFLDVESFSKDWSWQPVRIPGASNSAFEAQGYGSSAPTQRKQKVLLMPLLPLLHTNADFAKWHVWIFL